MKIKFLLSAALLVAMSGTSFAQNWPTTVTPTYGGGYTITTPGQWPTTVTPSYGGGYNINTPGQWPTTVTPTYGGGFTIYNPNQPYGQ